MRLFKFVVFLLLIITICSCKKEYEYKINIVNKTGYRINNLVLKGATDYKYALEKDGETGIVMIEWNGSRTHWFGGPYCFDYFVTSFSDTDSTYIDETPCIMGVVVKDLSMKKLNTLKLTKTDPGQSPCKHSFKIEYEKY